MNGVVIKAKNDVGWPRNVFLQLAFGFRFCIPQGGKSIFIEISKSKKNHQKLGYANRLGRPWPQGTGKMIKLLKKRNHFLNGVFNGVRLARNNFC